MFGLQERMRISGKILLFFTFLIIIGCGFSDEATISPNGNPKGTFYSLTVLNRFEPGLDAEKTRGKDLYSFYCTVCHGESGDGQGLNAYNLKSQFGVQPFNFTDVSAATQASYAEVKKVIARGGPAANKSRYMPPWSPMFSEYDLACLADYVWHSLMKMKTKQ